MSGNLVIPVSEIMPDRAAVLRVQGFNPGATPNSRVLAIVEQALAIFGNLAEPRGVTGDVTVDEFAAVYSGEGNNDPETPLAGIYPEADHLALFAVTVGGNVSSRIRELFADRDFALAALLDSVASEAADRAAAAAERQFAERLRLRGDLSSGDRALRYSPGYCGWHVTGQRALFKRLEPERIGITLRDSCLMEPLKSVSGVIICGPAGIHEFDPGFPFCSACKTQSCSARLLTQ